MRRPTCAGVSSIGRFHKSAVIVLTPFSDPGWPAGDAITEWQALLNTIERDADKGNDPQRVNDFATFILKPCAAARSRISNPLISYFPLRLRPHNPRVSLAY